MDSPFIKYVVPSVGCVLGIAMLLSPIKAVWQIRKTQQLGEINPLPYPMTALNCLGWVVYGAVLADPFISAPNILGMVAGVFFTLTAYPFCSQQIRDIIAGLFCGATGLYGILSLVDVFALDYPERKRMWGLTAVIILMGYYAIPLSTMREVLRKKDASSIYLPLACAAILNGSLWAVYGLALMDINIWGPNSFGVLIGCVQVGLRLLFGAKKSNSVKLPVSEHWDHDSGAHREDSTTRSLLALKPSFAGSSSFSDAGDSFTASLPSDGRGGHVAMVHEPLGGHANGHVHGQLSRFVPTAENGNGASAAGQSTTPMRSSPALSQPALAVKEVDGY